MWFVTMGLSSTNEKNKQEWIQLRLGRHAGAGGHYMRVFFGQLIQTQH